MIARPKPMPDSPVKTPTMRPGANLLMGRNALGTWFTATGGSGDFSHPFTVSVSGEKCRVSPGLVVADVSVEPMIGKVPLSGGEKTKPPVLDLDPGLTNDQGESWVCVEVTPNKEGKLGGEKGEADTTVKVEVVQRDAPTLMGGKTGRTPLAILRYKSAKSRPEVFQIAFFHLRYQSGGTAEKRRHFFL